MPCITRAEPPTLWGSAAIAFASSLGPFATNGCVPGFHSMSESLGVPLVSLQWTLSVYLSAFAVFSLLVGALSDAVGRKPVLIGGMSLFLAASIGALFSNSLNELLAWRILQGAGASTGQVITQAMVRDRWSGLAATKVMSLIGMLFSISPAIAPIVGGQLVVYWSWESMFVFLAIYAGAIVAVAIFVLPESLALKSRRPFKLRTLLQGYGICLTSRAFLFGIISNGANFMGAILVVAAGADYIVNVLGLGVDQFAYVSIPLVIVSVAGSYCAPPLLSRFGANRLLFGTAFLLILTLTVATAFHLAGQSAYPVALLGPLAYGFAMNLMRPVTMVMNLDYHPNMRGLAASIQQAFWTGGFVLACSLLTPLVLGVLWKYTLAMMLCAILTTASWALSVHYRKRELPSK